jgi:NTP pyrophosphatase (non-canonical NTP hydrolase)
MLHNIKLVKQWADDRGLISDSTSKDQFIKCVEEGGEIFEALLKRDKELLVDAIGDTLVVLTIICEIEGLGADKYIKRVRPKNTHSFKSFESGVISSLNISNALEFAAFQGELARALCEGDPVEGHIIRMVAALNYMCHFTCVDIGECYRIAYTVIRDRTGRKVDGVFVKDE